MVNYGLIGILDCRFTFFSSNIVFVRNKGKQPEKDDQPRTEIGFKRKGK